MIFWTNFATKQCLLFILSTGEPVSVESVKQDRNDVTLDNKKNSYVLLSVMIGVTCIALGSLIAGFIVFRNKLGKQF